MEQIASFAIYMLTITSITFILALSLDLQVGHCGIVNFGQVMFLVVGAYATAIAIAGGVGIVGATIIAVITSTLLGVAMSLSVRNMSGTYWGILSLAMAEIIRIIALNEQWLTGGANGISVLTTVPNLTWIVVASAIAVFLIVRLMLASPFGRVIHVIREGDRLPLALGKNVLGFKMMTMAIGGAIGGLAGAYYALMQRYMSPDDAKPIETVRLLDEIQRLAGQKTEPARKVEPQLLHPRPAAPASPAVVNADTLQHLEELGASLAFVEKLVGMFLADGASTLVRMEKVLAAREYHEFRSLLHAMKGSSASIGTDRLTSLCERLGKLSDGELRLQASALHRKLADEMGEARRQLEHHIHNRRKSVG